MSDLIVAPAAPSLPTLVAAAGEGAQLRILEFFAASIRNAHTRRAYAGAAAEFLAWCEERGVASITAIQPLHVTAYIDGCGLASDPKGALFRTIGRGRAVLTKTPLPQANAYAMIGRRALAAGIGTKISNHTFRATGITTYLKNGGQLEVAAAMANHSSTRTTQLYDRRSDQVSLDEIERARI